MVFRARELGWEEMRLAGSRTRCPTGPGTWSSRSSACTTWTPTGKHDLFRRVRETRNPWSSATWSRSSPAAGSRRSPRLDILPAADQAEWCGGEVVWEADDLAVIRAVYD